MVSTGHRTMHGLTSRSRSAMLIPALRAFAGIMVPAALVLDPTCARAHEPLLDAALAGVRAEPALTAKWQTTPVQQSDAAARSAAHAPASPQDSLRMQLRVYEAVRYYLIKPSKRWRDEVLKRLDSAAVVIPGDEWLAGERTRWSTNPPAAGTAAQAPPCLASVWWCELLAMNRLHVAAQYARADSMLTSAISHMSPEVRCVWGDISRLIYDRAARGRYLKMSCEERADVERIFWWMTDPMFSIPGNERRVEHYAREIRMRLDAERFAQRIRGFPWGLQNMRRATHATLGSDLLEQRSGRWSEEVAAAHPPKGFFDRIFDVNNRTDPRIDDWVPRLERAITRGHVAGATREFPRYAQQLVPSYSVVQSPFLATVDDWRTVAVGNWWERSLATVGRIAPLDYQLAYFRRGDSARVVVATDISSVDFMRGSLARGTMAYMRSPDDRVLSTLATGVSRFVFSPVVPTDSMVYSVEIVALRRGAGRARFGAAPKPRQPTRIALSDLLFYEPNRSDTAAAATLDAFAGGALPSVRVARGRSVGLFWEVYGLLAGEEPTYSLSAVRAVDAGRSTDSAPGTLRIGWSDVDAGGSGLDPRHIVVDLSSLRPGRYVLELKVEVDGVTAVSSKEVEIVRAE